MSENEITGSKRTRFFIPFLVWALVWVFGGAGLDYLCGTHTPMVISMFCGVMGWLSVLVWYGSKP